MDTSPTFDARFDALAALSYQVAYRLVGDRHVAENLAQEALSRAFARWSKVVGHEEAWVVRVTTNLAIGRWRRRRPSEPLEDRPDRETRLDVAERLDLTQALHALPGRQREAVVFRYLGELTEAQTAAAMGCSVGTVKQHTHRALIALRAELGVSPPPGPSDRAAMATTGVDEESHVPTPG